jgi:hypothetical protein
MGLPERHGSAHRNQKFGGQSCPKSVAIHNQITYKYYNANKYQIQRLKLSQHLFLINFNLKSRSTINVELIKRTTPPSRSTI